MRFNLAVVAGVAITAVAAGPTVVTVTIPSKVSAENNVNAQCDFCQELSRTFFLKVPGKRTYESVNKAIDNGICNEFPYGVKWPRCENFLEGNKEKYVDALVEVELEDTWGVCAAAGFCPGSAGGFLNLNKSQEWSSEG